MLAITPHEIFSFDSIKINKYKSEIYFWNGENKVFLIKCSEGEVYNYFEYIADKINNTSRYGYIDLRDHLIRE